MNNEDVVAGFQFSISGLTGASAAGGSAEAAGFSVSVGATGTVLGFSFSGATIPAGNGLLTLITFHFTKVENECILNFLIFQILNENTYDE